MALYKVVRPTGNSYKVMARKMTIEGRGVLCFWSNTQIIKLVSEQEWLSAHLDETAKKEGTRGCMK